MRRTEHGIHFREEDYTGSEHLINMFCGIAATTFIVDGAVVHLAPLRRIAEPLGCPNGLQFVEGNSSPDSPRTIGSIPMELNAEVSVATLGRLLPLEV